MQRPAAPGATSPGPGTLAEPEGPKRPRGGRNPGATSSCRLGQCLPTSPGAGAQHRHRRGRLSGPAPLNLPKYSPAARSPGPRPHTRRGTVCNTVDLGQPGSRPRGRRHRPSGNSPGQDSRNGAEQHRGARHPLLGASLTSPSLGQGRGGPRREDGESGVRGAAGAGFAHAHGRGVQGSRQPTVSGAGVLFDRRPLFYASRPRCGGSPGGRWPRAENGGVQGPPHCVREGSALLGGPFTSWVRERRGWGRGVILAAHQVSHAGGLRPCDPSPTPTEHAGTAPPPQTGAVTGDHGGRARGHAGAGPRSREPDSRPQEAGKAGARAGGPAAGTSGTPSSRPRGAPSRPCPHPGKCHLKQPQAEVSPPRCWPVSTPP